MPSRLSTPEPAQLAELDRDLRRDDAVHRRGQQRQLEQVRAEPPADVHVLRVARPPGRHDRDVVEPVRLPRLLASPDLDLHARYLPWMQTKAQAACDRLGRMFNVLAAVSQVDGDGAPSSDDSGTRAGRSPATSTVAASAAAVARLEHGPAPTSCVLAAPTASAARRASSSGSRSRAAPRRTPASRTSPEPTDGDGLDPRRTRPGTAACDHGRAAEQRVAAGLERDQRRSRRPSRRSAQARAGSPRRSGTRGRPAPRPRAGWATPGSARRPAPGAAARPPSRSRCAPCAGACSRISVGVEAVATLRGRLPAKTTTVDGALHR